MERPTRKEAAAETSMWRHQSLDAEGGSAVSMAREGQIPETENYPHHHSERSRPREKAVKGDAKVRPGCPHAQEHGRGHDA